MDLGTTYSKVRFSDGIGINSDINLPNGFPTNGTYVTNDPGGTGVISDNLTVSTGQSGTNAIILEGAQVTVEGFVQNPAGVSEWQGWYSDPELTNQLTENNVLAFTVGTPPYGNPASITIHLYAKVISGI